jgi:cobalt transporter subunit CbtA
MTSKLFTSALFAGLLAGLIAILLQFFLMEPLVLEGEKYETGAKVHFGGVMAGHDGADEATQAHVEGDGHSHETDGHEDGEGTNTARFAKAFFAEFVAWVGFGLVMVAGFAIAERFGQTITTQAGLLWGIAGFVSFQLMPGLGLSPELPGVPAADLNARQIWWLGCAIATVMAMVAFGYGRSPVFIAAGVGLLIAPHLIGAPHLDEFLGTAPPGLAAEFVTHSMVLSMATWTVLGVLAGYFWHRQSAAPV